MPHLILKYLGAFQGHLDSIPLTHFHSVKVQALLAYLTLEAARPHTRETLMALLWPDDAPQSAQQSLRQALYALRRTLGDTDNPVGEPFLLVTRQTVQFNPRAAYSLDVATFLRHLQQEEQEQAVALYRADLLAGLTTDSVPFEEWLRATREYLHNLTLNALGQLTQQRLDNGGYAHAVTYARRQLSLEPWREEAHRQVMTALALSGDRSAALAQYESCRRVLGDELGVQPDEETTQLYEQIKAGKLRGQTATLHPHSTSSKLEEASVYSAATATIRHNLPSQPTPFVGRKTDLEQIATRLHDPVCRLLTIIGPGGMGKTRLAIQAAQTVADVPAMLQGNSSTSTHPWRFDDGIFFVALAGVGSSNLLISTIAAVLNFTFYEGSEPKSQLLAYLKTKSLLLVLDNFEHLLDGADLVTEFLVATTRLKVLTTSREPLNLREEWLHPLTGMSFPMGKANWGALVNYTAVQLFLQCAQRMKPDFELADESSAVVRICQLVEGMPLGIELAATWLKFYPCPQIVQEMQRSLDFLTTTVRNIPDRHRSMRAVFDHSWQLLTVEEQKIFAKLAVFRSGFTPVAAQQVAGATLPQLLALAEKSLLQVTSTGRFQLHELLRQFAEQRLQENAHEHVQACNDHAHFYLKLLSAQEVQLKGAGIFDALQIIESEQDNIRTAWSWALAHEFWPAIADALEPFWYFYDIKGWHMEGRATFGQVVDHLRTVVVQHAADTAKYHTLTLLLGRALCYFGVIQSPLGLHGQVEAILRESLTWLEKTEPSPARAKAVVLTALGVGLGWQGRCLEAIPLIDESAAIFRAIGDRWWYAATLHILSQLYTPLGRYEEAERLAEGSNAVFDALHEQYYSLYNLDTLGHLARANGCYTQAERHFQAHLERHNALGRQIGVAFAYCELGEVARLQGRPDQAESYYRQAIAIGEEIAANLPIQQALWGLGCLAEGLGDYVTALHYFEASQGADGADFFPNASSAHPGWAAVGLHNLSAAVGYFGAVLQRAAALQQAPLALEALVGLAYLYNYSGDSARGAALLALAARHPALHQETRDRIAYVQTVFGDQSLAASTTETSEESADLWQTVENLLAALPSKMAPERNGNFINSSREESPGLTLSPTKKSGSTGSQGVDK